MTSILNMMNMLRKKSRSFYGNLSQQHVFFENGKVYLLKLSHFLFQNVS